MTAIRSAKYLRGSKGASCKLRIPGVCTGDIETTIPAHIHDRNTGRSTKASDLSVADACFACHEVFDRRAKMPGFGGASDYLITDAEWRFYALRGLQETLEARHAAGLLVVALDASKPFGDRPPKKRKPPEQRRPVPAGRPLQSGSTFPAREPQHSATTPLSKRGNVRMI